jgi:hypothetical protein
MTELERALRGLSAEIEYPLTPDLAGMVAGRIREAERGGAGALRRGRAWLLPPRTLRRSLVVAIAVLLIAAGAVFAAASGVRNTVLDFFGLRGATVEVRSELPKADLATRLRLGDPLPLTEVRRMASFSPLVPRSLPPPKRTYLRRTAWGDEVTLVYTPQPRLPRAPYGFGLLIGQFRGDLVPGYVSKIVGRSTSVERLRIDGHRAIWIAGAPHYFVYRAPDGRVIEGTLRLARNVLLVERGRLLVRLEGELSKRRALAIASSLR